MKSKKNQTFIYFLSLLPRSRIHTHSHDRAIVRKTGEVSDALKRSELMKLPPPSRTCIVNVLKVTTLDDWNGPKLEGRFARS